MLFPFNSTCSFSGALVPAEGLIQQRCRGDGEASSRGCRCTRVPQDTNHRPVYETVCGLSGFLLSNSSDSLLIKQLNFHL